MGNDTSLWSKFFGAVLSLYVLSVCLAAAYFNVQCPRDNGFLTWAFFGEIVPSLKATVWPYYAFRHNANPPPAPKPLTEAQLAGMELKKMVDAVNYSQQATLLINEGHTNGGIRQYTNIDKIVEYRRLAYETGQKANIDFLNKVFPELGTHFRDQFLQSVQLFLAAYDADSPSLLQQAGTLSDQWADWYQPNQSAIQAAADKALGY